WGLDPRRDLGARRFIGRLGAMQRTRPRYRTGHQHLRRAALVMEIAIGEAHARHRAAKADFVFLVEIEARLERNAPDRRTHRLTADLKRIAGQPDMAHRTGAGKLYRTDRAHIVEDAGRDAWGIGRGERENPARPRPPGP